MKVKDLYWEATNTLFLPSQENAYTYLHVGPELTNNGVRAYLTITDSSSIVVYKHTITLWRETIPEIIHKLNNVEGYTRPWPGMKDNTKVSISPNYIYDADENENTHSELAPTVVRISDGDNDGYSEDLVALTKGDTMRLTEWLQRFLDNKFQPYDGYTPRQVQ